MHILVAKRPLEITLFVSYEIFLRLLNAYRSLVFLCEGMSKSPIIEVKKEIFKGINSRIPLITFRFAGFIAGHARSSLPTGCGGLDPSSHSLSR